MTRSGSANLCIIFALLLALQSAFGYTLTLRGTLGLPSCRAVDAQGSTVYTATVSEVYVINVSNPASPVSVGHVPFGTGQISAMAAAGSYVYCAAQSGGMVVVNVSDPAHPAVVTHYTVATSVRGIDVQDTLVALVTTANVLLIGVRDPAHPHMLASYGRQGNWVQFDPSELRLHVGSTAGVFDLSITVHNDNTVSLSTHHSYGSGLMFPLAVVGDYLDIASNQSLIDLDAGDYSYMATYQAGAVISGVAGIPGWAFITVNTPAVVMLDHRRGLPENPIAVGIPGVPTGIAVASSGSQHLLAVSHDAGLSVLAYDTVAATAPELPPVIPGSLSLRAYPNPFNSAAELQVAVPRPGRYDLTVFDALGREVTRQTLTLSGNAVARLDFERRAPGIYFARLSNYQMSTTTKLIYLP